jgi:hypothetical protein
LAAVPAHQEEPRFAVEEKVREVKAQSAQGIAWPPPRAKAEDYGVGRSLNAADSLSTQSIRQEDREEFTFKFSIE